MANLNLNTSCYTIEDGKIVKGILQDFNHFIEYANRPEGTMPKYFISFDSDARQWAVAKFEFNKEIIVCFCYSKISANEKLMDLFIYDILNNNEYPIYLNLACAEEALLDF